jgi:hypothetical protein
MEMDRTVSFDLLEGVIGASIEIMSNDFSETPGHEGSVNTYQKITFQIKEEEPDILAVGVLFALSLISFTYMVRRGYSEKEFTPDEQWNLGYFVKGLEFAQKTLCFSSDYVSGRPMKMHITFEPGRKITLTTTNRGRGRKVADPSSEKAGHKICPVNRRLDLN